MRETAVPSRVETYVLERISAGYLRFNENGQLEHYNLRQKRWCIKKVQRHNKSGRARYTFGLPKSVFSSGRKRGKRIGYVVYRNRLTWMLMHGAIPKGCVVEHKDGNKYNDDVDNLELMGTQASNVQGGQVHNARAVDAACSWFDYVALHGREPTAEEAEAFSAQPLDDTPF